ncbi:MAG TPA: 2-amino-3,7-dideoxy-D-threo-hept-6-ulosonate synthase [Patescibacteria group bacterium]|nr:2-amino-3,7-dideoxy-D-threo-hept-6-ulosonate synthase [Patescibacteria group bacterium]
MNVGKKIRLERIMNRKTGKTVIVPMDHGMTVGPIFGIEKMDQAVGKVAQGGANAVVMHQGIVGPGYRGQGPDIGLIIHLSASTSLAADSNRKKLVCSVERAIQLGADAVSIHVNIGNGHEGEMLNDFGAVSEKCVQWGMPLMAMVYPRGEGIEDEYDVGVVKHAARVGSEMGADLVKVSYTGSPESFREVVQGCNVPVVIAGGTKMDSDGDILEMVSGAVQAGAAGLSIGRNVFQHKDPAKLVKAMSLIVHGGISPAEASEVLQNRSVA